MKPKLATLAVLILPVLASCASELDPEVPRATLTTVHLSPDGNQTIDVVPLDSDPAMDGVGSSTQAITGTTPFDPSLDCPQGVLLRGLIAPFIQRTSYLCLTGVGRADLASYPQYASIKEPGSNVFVWKPIGTWAGQVSAYWLRGSLTHAYIRDFSGHMFELGREPVAPGGGGPKGPPVSYAASVLIDVADQTGNCLQPAQACGTRTCGTVSNGCGGVVSCEARCLGSALRAFCSSHDTCVVPCTGPLCRKLVLPL